MGTGISDCADGSAVGVCCNCHERREHLTTSCKDVCSRKGEYDHEAGDEIGVCFDQDSLASASARNGLGLPLVACSPFDGEDRACCQDQAFDPTELIHRPRSDSAAGSEALDQIPDLLQLKRDGVRGFADGVPGDGLYYPVSSASSTCNHPDRLFRSAPQPAAHSPLITVSPND